MVNPCQTRQRRWVSLATFGAILLTAQGMTGCSSAPTTAQQHHDPLHGVLVPPGVTPPPTNAPKTTNTPIAAPVTGSINGIPPIPTNNTATNPATLAGTSGFQVSLAKPLAIIDEEGRMQTAVRSQPAGFVPANSNPKVEQIPDLPSNTPNTAPTGSWQLPSANAPPALPAADTLRQQLQARGVVNEKVDPLAEGVRLTCYVPRNDSQGLRVLEVTATDYTSAAQAILRQLDNLPSQSR